MFVLAQGVQAIDAGRPSRQMSVARILAIEALLDQDEARPSGHRLEGHRDFGFAAVCSMRLFPRPGESQSSWRFDDAKETAHRSLPAAGTTQDDPPSPARSHLQIVNHGLVAVWSPPSRDLVRFDPQREETFARCGDKSFKAKHLSRSVHATHDFFCLGVCSAANASSL